MTVFYVDIDGTLTDAPEKRWGKIYQDRIDKIKELCVNNVVVIWSAGGWKYAIDFCKQYKLQPTAILPKPDFIVDDISSIRTEGIIKIINPENITKL